MLTAAATIFAAVITAAAVLVGAVITARKPRRTVHEFAFRPYDAGPSTWARVADKVGVVVALILFFIGLMFFELALVGWLQSVASVEHPARSLLVLMTVSSALVFSLAALVRLRTRLPKTVNEESDDEDDDDG